MTRGKQGSNRGFHVLAPALRRDVGGRKNDVVPFHLHELSARPDGTGCTLDTAALADAGAPLRRALINRPDLIVAEKFGEQERSGGGLVDDILDVIAEGLPILVLVPESALACWRELTGGETAEVSCEAEALRRWWRDRFAGKS